ncbi:hypothetical protein [Chitinimonas sp. BJYL2]|uniref:hypothetical protein n=1 Tax=Chitinimonas sp. BJYL2 TaxID=2976696 RepID=UPI0022B52D9D|nr:hypothetical protein [Chitinimonas sp. BJYL2]
MAKLDQHLDRRLDAPLIVAIFSAGQLFLKGHLLAGLLAAPLASMLAYGLFHLLRIWGDSLLAWLFTLMVGSLLSAALITLFIRLLI